MGGFASSRILEVHGERMISGRSRRDSVSRCTRRISTRRCRARRRWRSACRIPPPAEELFNVCAANGDGELDHSALVRALEIMGNHRAKGFRHLICRLIVRIRDVRH